MWAIPTSTSSVLKKKNIQVKSPSIWSRVSETGSDPSIGSDWDSGRDNTTLFLVQVTNIKNNSLYE